jgi:oligosaccharide repeat unit polymerase
MSIFGFVILTLVTFLPLRRHWQKTNHLDFGEIIYPVVAYLYLGMGVRGLWLSSGFVETPVAEVDEILQNHPSACLYLFLLTAVGVACLYAGYFSKRSHPLAVSIARSRTFAGPHSRRMISCLCALCAIVAVAAAFQLWRGYGWQNESSGVPGAFVKRTAEGGLYPMTGLFRLAFMGALISAALVAKHSQFSARFVLLLNIAATGFSFLLTSSKESLFVLLFGLLIVRNYLKKPITGRAVLISLVLAILSYPALVAYRYSGTDMFEDGQPLGAVGAGMLLERSHQFDSALLILDRVKSFEHLAYGSWLNDIVYFYIPRAIWPNKPMAFGYRFGEEFEPSIFHMGETGSETPSLIGELFLNFHIVGVMCGMYLFGRFLKGIYVFLRTGGLSPLRTGAYALFVLNAVHVVEGPIAGHMSTFIVDILPIVCIGIAASSAPAVRSRQRNQNIVSPATV